MTDTMSLSLDEHTVPRTRDIILLFCLAGLSGAALIGRVFWNISMLWTVGFLTLPAGIGIAILAFSGRRCHGAARIIADRVIAGAKWGLIATLAYDAVRPFLVWAFRLHFAPYRSHPIFGHLITGRPTTAGVAIIVGWIYHFWNGVSFGVMLALLKPRATPAQGVFWALCLQACMMAVYPKFLEVRLNNPNFALSAPEEVVEEAQANLAARQEEAAKLQAALTRLAELG